MTGRDHDPEARQSVFLDDPGHRGKLLIGMLHLPRLREGPGAVEVSQAAELMVRDALALARAGFDGLILENFGDSPFRPGAAEPFTVAAMAAVAQRVVDRLPEPRIRIGFNVLRNDVVSALGLAAALGGDYVRVNVHTGARLTDQGIVEGRAYESVRLRDRLAPRCRIMADLAVKHSAALTERPLAEEAQETFRRGHADVLIVSGSGTGEETSSGDLDIVRQAVPEAPLLVGSGLTMDNAPKLLTRCDGAIVGTAVKKKGRTKAEVDPGRARELAAEVRRNFPGPASFGP